MKSKRYFWMMAGILFLCLCIAVVSAASMYYPVKNIDRGKGYLTIQAAIDDPSTVNGDHITVDSGTYAPFSVSKAVTIQGIDTGEGFPVVALPGPSSGDAILITGPSGATGPVTIKDFTLNSIYEASGPLLPKGTGIRVERSYTELSDIEVKDFQDGVSISGYSHNKIQRSRFFQNRNGIVLGDSHANIIDLCTFRGFMGVDESWHGLGLHLMQGSSQNIIQYSSFSELFNGIELHQVASQNQILYNDLSYNDAHAILLDAPNNIVKSNYITDNPFQGIGVTEFGGGDTITNNFLKQAENGDNAVINATVSDVWNTDPPTPGTNIVGGPTLGGNYWAKFDGTGCSETCADANTDGFCDSACAIPNGADTDNYPLTMPSEPNVPTVDSIDPASNANTGTVAVTIDGDNFADGARPKLITWIDESGFEIPAETGFSGTGTQITCDFDLTGAPSGVYDVIVTNPDGQEGALSEGFTVTPSMTPPKIVAIVIDNNEDIFPDGEVPEGTLIKVSDPWPVGSILPFFPGLGSVTVPSADECGDGSANVYAVIINTDTEANYVFPVTVDFVCENGQYIAGIEQRSEPLIPLSLVEGTVPNVAGLTPCKVEINNMFKTFAGGSASCTANTEHNYALLISGGLDKDHNPARYYNDIKFMYNTLVTDYGYDKSRIKVLMSDGPDINQNPDKIDYYDQDKKPVYGNSDPNLDGDLLGNSDVYGPATKEKVQQALADWSTGPNALTAEDSLFVFTTGHGAMLSESSAGPNNNEVVLYLWNDGSHSDDETYLYFTDAEFIGLLPKSAGSIMMTMEQCNGGGFINDFITGGAQTRVISTAANGNEVSHSNDFSYPWISAAAGHDAAPTPSLTDADIAPVDSQISMSEAFTYARDRDASARAGVETPQSVSSTAGADATQFLSPPCSPIYSIIISSPVGKPTWSGGQTPTITWAYSGPRSDTVRIELWKDTQWGALKQLDISKSVTMTSASQSYSWKVPTSLPLGNGLYYIKISTNSPAPPVSAQSNVTISSATTQRAGTMTIKSTPLTGASIWINDVMSGTTDTTPTSMPPLTYPVKVALTSYYPIGPTNVKVNQGLPTTKSFPLVAVEQTDNALLGLTHVTIDSNPDGASIFINGVDTGMVTDMMTHAGKDLPTGAYQIFVTKDGYQNSDIKLVTIPGLIQDQSRCSPSSVNLNFDLQSIGVVQAKVLILPQPLNIGKPSSYFAAIVTLTLPKGVKAADGVKAAAVDAGTVTCNGAQALVLLRDAKWFPQTFVAIFSRQDLDPTQTGRVTMTVGGSIRKSGGNPIFTGSNTIQVTNKKTTAKEAIDDWKKMTPLQFITNFFR